MENVKITLPGNLLLSKRRSLASFGAQVVFSSVIVIVALIILRWLHVKELGMIDYAQKLHVLRENLTSLEQETPPDLFSLGEVNRELEQKRVEVRQLFNQRELENYASGLFSLGEVSRENFEQKRIEMQQLINQRENYALEGVMNYVI